MKKVIGIAVLVFVGLLVISVVSGNDTDNTPTSGNDIEYQNPINNNSAEQAFCLQKAQEIGSLYTEYSLILPSVSTVAEVRAAITTGRSLTDLGRLWLTRCDQYFPNESSSIRTDLNNFEDVLDELENSL